METEFFPYFKETAFNFLIFVSSEDDKTKFHCLQDNDLESSAKRYNMATHLLHQNLLGALDLEGVFVWGHPLA